MDWMLLLEWLSRLILLLLGLLSVYSFSIIINRIKVFKALDALDNFESLKRLIEKREFDQLPLISAQNIGVRTQVLAVAHSLATKNTAEGDVKIQKIDRSVRSYLSSEKIELEKGLNTLATLGSNAPFIGLLGTVLGIIHAFGALSKNQGSSASVMSGISEALIATAVGLFVAIPAVIAFNVFSKKIKTIFAECESLRDLYISNAD